MPIRVPSINGVPVQQNPVQSGGTPVTQNPASVVGPQLQRAGQAAQASGFGITRLGQGLIDSANDAMSKQQATLHAQELDQLLRGYEGKLTAEAHDGYEPLLKEIEKLRGRHAKSLKNPQQGQLYGRMVDAQVLQAQSRAGRHFERQTRAWNLEQTEVSLTRFVHEWQTAAMLGDEDDDERMARMKVARDAMEIEFAKLVKLSGLDPETAKLKRDEQLSKVHADTMQMLTNVSSDQARDYYDEFQGEMAPKARASAKASVDAADVKDRALAKMRELTAGAGEDATPTEMLQAVMDGASKITDADEFNAVMSMAGAEYNRRVRVDAGTKNDLLDEAERTVFSEGGEFLTFEQLPPSLQQELRENGLVDEVMAIMGKRDRATREMKMQELFRTPAVLQGMAPEVYQRTYYPHLSKADRELADVIYARENGLPLPQTPVKDIVNHLDIFAYQLDRNGYTKEAIKENPKLEVEARNLRMAFARLAERGGVTKEMSIDEVEKSIATLFRQRATADRGDVPLLAYAEGATIQVRLSNGSVVKSKVGAVPDQKGFGPIGVRGWIVQKLQQDGVVAPTEEQIQAVWFELRKPKSAMEAAQRDIDPALLEAVKPQPDPDAWALDPSFGTDPSTGLTTAYPKRHGR